jgi:uncharacterized protein (DUF697 family)
MDMVKTVLLTAWGLAKQLPVWWFIGLVGVVIGSAVATVVTYDICNCAL